jgi:hypothetical protein
MTTKIIRPLFLVAFVALLTFATSLRAAIAPAENLLPADTLAFFTVPDCTALRAASKVSPQMMFWNDAAMKPFHDKFMAKLNEKFTAPLEHDLGVKVADFMGLPQGQFTLAVTVNGSTGHDDVPPGILLLLDAKGKSDSLKTNLAALQKKWAADGRALRTEKFHGLAFTVVPLSSNDFAGIFPKRAPVQELGKEPKVEKPGELYFAQFESLLIAGNSAKVVEPVAAHLTGGSVPALVDDATFAADKLAQFRDAPTYYGWFNGNKFFMMLTESPASAEGDPASMMPKFNAAKILGVTGLGSLKSASFALREARDGSALTLHLSAPEATRAGLLKILAIAPKDAGAPVFVPAESVKFSRFRLDGKQTWTELQKMIAGISPGGLASLNAVIDMANSFGQQKNPGFDLRTALVGNLGDDIITYQKAPVGDSLVALSSPPTLFLVAVANADQTIDAIKTVAAMITPQDATKQAPREFLGHKIHTIALRPTRNAATGATTTSSLYFAASGGYLALSTDTAMLEEYLRSADGKVKPLRETAGLAEAAQRVGGTGGGMFGYQNQRETMRQSFKLLKNASEANSAMKMFPPAFREWVDFALLPDYGAVQKYFYMSVFAGNANADGLTMKVFTPRPSQLN